MRKAFGSVSFSLTVFVPSRHADLPARPKRVKLSTVWCEYSQRHDVVSEFKLSNSSLYTCEIQSEFVFRECLDLDFTEVER
jgi:hypothetical protein